MNDQSITLTQWQQQIRWMPHRDKKPYDAKTGKANLWSYSAAWSDYETASAIGGKHVGVVLGDGLVCVDLDKCLWVDTSRAKPVTRVKPAFKPLFDRAREKGAYIEISQSGRGLHIFLRSDWSGNIKAKFPQRLVSISDGKPVEDVCSGGGVEIYGGRNADGRATRYIAVTNNTRACGAAQAITMCDVVLEVALKLAAEAKAEADALKSGKPVDTPTTACEPKSVSLLATEPDDIKITDVKTTDDDEAAVLPVGSRVTPYFLVNKLAVLGADLWFPELFDGAEKRGGVWRGRTPDASRDDISLHPTGLKWWKDDDVRTPVDAVMKFADADRELSAPEAVGWLVDRLGLEPAALKGIATLAVNNSRDAPRDIFADGTDVALPWVAGTLPSVLEDYAGCMAEELGVNPSCMALMFLIACGASVPAGVRFQPDPAKPGWVVPATAWGILLAPSGAAKSPVLDEAMRPVYAVHDKWAEEHKSRIRCTEDKAEKERLQKLGPKRRITNGATTEALLKLMSNQAEGIILHADEVAGAFDAVGKYNKGAHGGQSDSQVLLQMFESRSFNLDRKDEGRSVAVERAHGSLIGGIQPGVLGGMAASLTSNGMLQRALIGVMTATLFGAPCADLFGRETYHAVVRHIMRLGEVCGGEMLIVGTPELGSAMIVEGNKAREMILRDPTLSDVAKSVLGKTTGTLARITLWLHAIEWALANHEAVDVMDGEPVVVPETVGLETFQCAAKLWWGYCWPTALGVYDGAGLGCSVVNDARNAGAYILAHEDKFGQPFTARAFRGIRAFEGQAGMGRLFAALDLLVEKRWLRVVDKQGNGAPVYEADGRAWTLFAGRLPANSA